MIGDLIGDLIGTAARALRDRFAVGIEDGRRVGREGDREVAVVVVKFEDRLGRAILAHGAQDLADARAAAFGQVELLEQLADAPVAIAPRQRASCAEVVEPDRAVGTRVAEHDQILAPHPHLHGLTQLVAPMVHGVDHRLLDGRQREVGDAR